MCSTDGGKHDSMPALRLLLSKRPEGMKDNGPLYLSVIKPPNQRMSGT